MADVVLEIFLSSILISGLVTVMMMLIECFNVWSQGRLTGKVKNSGLWQIVLATLLGAVPGCMGGFAVVSMYTHGMVSFGALVSMMIASSGDESFVMLALMPREAAFIFLGLVAVALVTGILVDRFHTPSAIKRPCPDNYSVHSEDRIAGERHFGWKRTAIIAGTAVFLAALCLGWLEEEEAGAGAEAEFILGGINLLSEDWMNIMFAAFGLLVLAVTIFASDHFVEEHLWHHVVCHHLPKIFLWTAGALAVIAVLLHFVDLSAWFCDNVALMIVIAAAIGIIPESGPHMIFVTLFASGLIPLPVIVASCISQDGHAGLPLLAEDSRTFIKAKAINFTVSVLTGFCLMALPGIAA